MRLVIFAIINSFIVSTCFSQTVGSQEAYRQSIAGERRAEAAEFRKAKELQDFKDAKQISRSKDRLNAPLAFGAKLDPKQAESGSVGRLDHLDTSVIQIVDDSNCILDAGKGFLWLANYPTDDLADGQKVRIVDYVKALPSKDYKGHFIRAVELLSQEDNQKQQEKDLTENEKKLAHERAIQEQKEAAKLRDFREWKAKTGQKVEGKFLRFRASSVEIELRNGKKNSFRITALSDEDADIVRKLSKEDAEAKKSTK